MTNHPNRSRKRRGIRFYFDMYPEQIYEGFAAGGTWNGFDNVRITPAVAKEIEAFFASITDEGEPLTEIEPDADGLIDLSNGYTTVIL